MYLLRKGVADVQVSGLLGQFRSGCLGDRFMDDVATDGEADLPLVKKRSERRRGNRPVEIRVLEYDGGVVAAQFQRDFLQAAAGSFAHLSARRSRPCERDHIHIGVLDQRRPDVAAAMDYVEDTFRNAGELEELGQ